MAILGQYKGKEIKSGTDAEVKAQVDAIDNPTPTPASVVSKTPVVPPAPTPSPIPDVSKETARYSWSTPAGMDTAKQITQSVETPEAISERIQAEKEKNIQGQIAQIETASKQKEQELLTQGRSDMGRTNALSALMGLTGSVSAEERAKGSEQRTQKTIDLERANKAAKIDALYSRADENASKEIEAAQAANKENAQNLLNEIKTNADNIVKGLASTFKGVTWDDFATADPQKAQQLIKQSGKSEYEIRDMWKQAIPEAYRPVTGETYYSTADGKQTVVHQYSINKLTGKTTDNKYTIDIPFASFKPDALVKGTSGQLLMPTEDGKYIDITPGKPVSLAAGSKLIDPNTGKELANNPKPITPKSSPAGNKLTRSEAIAQGLPLSLVGMDEQQISRDMLSPTAPSWFESSMQELTGVVPQQDQLDTAWKSFKETYTTSGGVGKKITPPKGTVSGGSSSGRTR